MNNRATTIGTSVAALVFGYAANFLAPLGAESADMTNVVAMLVGSTFALLAAAGFAYRIKLGFASLFAAVILFQILNLCSSSISNVANSFVSPFVHGVASGLSISITGYALWLLPRKHLASWVTLGYALSILVVPVSHLLSSLPSTYIHSALTLLYDLCLAAILIVNPAARKTPASACDTLHKQGGLHNFWKELASSDPSAAPMLVLATLLSSVTGLFLGYAATNGQPFATTDLSMVVLFAILVVVLLISLWRPSPSWFNVLFMGLMLASILGLLAVMLFSNASTILSGIFGGALVVAMIPVCVFAIAIAKDQNVSPIFICGTLPMIITLSYQLGYLTNLLLMRYAGMAAYNISKVAAVCLALVAIVVVALFALSSTRHNQIAPILKKTSAQNGSRYTTDNSDELIQLLVDRKGFSPREAEISVLFAQGRSAPYIAKQLFLAESTVKSHIRRAYAKMGVHNRQDFLDALEATRPDASAH